MYVFMCEDEDKYMLVEIHCLTQCMPTSICVSSKTVPQQRRATIPAVLSITQRSIHHAATGQS